MMKLLQRCQDFGSVDEFIQFVEDKLRDQPRFYMCVAFSSKAGTEFQFFEPSEADGPDAAYRAVTALTVATRASRVFIGYMADVAQLLGQDLGLFQAVFFMADRRGSTPYTFCKMLPEPDAWLIRPFADMNERDPKNRILLADICDYIQSSPGSEVANARDSCRRWLPAYTWDWQSYDT